MTPLTQQLEDKKKELEELNKVETEFDYQTTGDGVIILHNPKFIHLKEIIAILEQAIAEMQKQRQEILDRNLEIANMLDDMFINFSTMDYSKKGDTWTILKQDWNKCIKELKQQLNQPKEEDFK
jgi:hypothetical protein